jgi:probable phosphoglycerate mutase
MKRSSKTPPPSSARLFSESHAAAPPAGVHIANIDGASRGNPGPASYAVVIRDPSGKIILELAKNIGRETNNIAEYYALLAALDYATSHNISALRIRSDSELLVRQMQGRYKVKSADLKPLHERASKMAKQLGYFAIEHVRRELNRDADALANVALDQAGVPKFGRAGNTTSESRANLHSALASRPMTAESNPKVESRRIRARFANGVLVPIEPLDLPEGAEIAIEIRLRGDKT